MLYVPDNETDILQFASEVVKNSTGSLGVRSAYYRSLNMVYETGRFDGTKALINMMPNHIQRLAGMLFSPVELKFTGTFAVPQPTLELSRLTAACKVLSSRWTTPGQNGDVVWGRGVVEALKYGSAFLKQWVELEWGKPIFQQKLVMPWQLGVYDETETDLNKQEVIVEVSSLTMPAVWKRIYHLPNAEALYRQIEAKASATPGRSQPDSFFHTVLSTSQLQTGTANSTSAVPGGIVQINQNPNYALMGPVVTAPTVNFYEIWVKGQDDYITLQTIDTDVLVTKFRNANLLGVKRKQPYRIIQPNETTNYLWGRSELVDLIEPQGLLATWCDDLRRMYGLQVDKILAFIGEGGITDEKYGAFRGTGYVSMPAGSDVKDLTPKIPPEALPLLRFVIEIINTIAGFPPVMQGQGDSGVRAGVQLNTLMKTASPTQRDRALLVERQIADAATLSFEIIRAKDATYYWVDGSTPETAEQTKFLFTDIPDEYTITVDSHSSSPIFSDENAQLIFQARKIGDVDGEYMLDNLPFPNKENAKVSLRARQKARDQAQQEVRAEVAKLPAEQQGKVIEKVAARKLA